MTTRRAFLMRAGVAALGSALPARSVSLPVSALEPDYRLKIDHCRFEVARNKFLNTIAYNQHVPGPVLRLKQGRRVTIDVTNGTSRPEVVHWHGLGLPPEIDGAMEEGTPMIAPGATTRVQFAPDKAGLRWYHTHTMAGNDLRVAQYAGLHGVMSIEPAGGSTVSYDREMTLVLHDWDGQMLSSDDGMLKPAYKYSTINGRIEEFNEPLPVKQGERVLLQVLNSSATEIHWLVFSGHTMQVIALDGNALDVPREARMLRLAPAERVTALVVMDKPGRWVIGEPRKHVRSAGMGIVVEYAGATGEAVFAQPDALRWDYMDFVQKRAEASGDAVEVIPLAIESKFHGHGAEEQWLLNGYSYPQPNAPVLQAGKRYRLRFENRSTDDHPLHLHRHTFRLMKIGEKEFRGPLKDVVLVDAKTSVEVEFTADNPGATLLHCHQQDHMDRGFMMVLRYA